MVIEVIKARWGAFDSFSIKNAEIGDKLMVSSGRGSFSYTPVTVTKVSATQIATSDGNRWMKETHRCVGASEWTRLSLMMHDESIMAKAKEETTRQQLAYKMQNTDYKRYSVETLRQIAAIIEQEEKKHVAAS